MGSFQDLIWAQIAQNQKYKVILIFIGFTQKKGLFYSEYDSLYLHKRITPFSDHIDAIPLHVCLGYDFWSLLLPLIWNELRSFSTFEKNIGWT